MNRMNQKKQRGFTLIELLVVIAIIGILASVILASLNQARAKSRDARRLADIKQIQTSLELYFDANSTKYPTNTGLLVPTYIPVLPTDPSTQAAYPYTALGSGTACGSYHLRATLENSAHTALNNDADAASAGSGGTCTNGAASPSVADAAGTDPIYDVKP